MNIYRRKKDASSFNLDSLFFPVDFEMSFWEGSHILDMIISAVWY